MNDRHDGGEEPRWLTLVAGVRAEPEGATLERVRARLLRRGAAPAWLRGLAHPATLAGAGALVVVSAFTGNSMLADLSSVSDGDTGILSALLGDDGSFGLPVDHVATAGSPAAPPVPVDSEAVER